MIKRVKKRCFIRTIIYIHSCVSAFASDLFEFEKASIN